MNPFKKTIQRPFEFIAEQAVKIVASGTILLIFLIFAFVFKEAVTLFAPASAPAVATAPPAEHSTSQTTQSTPEASSSLSAMHGDDEGKANANNAEHILYVPANPKYPEIYNAESGNLPADIDDATRSVDVNARPPKTQSLVKNLVSSVWQPVGESPKYGLLPLCVGTAKTTLVAIVIGAPLGILAALYVAFFAPRRIREIVKPVIELLAGFPTVVIGFFCLVTVASFLQSTFGFDFRLNALVGGIGMSLAVIPIVFSISEDALSSVPKSLREASLALGSSEWQTAYRVMLPAAAPGVIAAVILGIGRAFGETMIALMATGNAALMSWNVATPGRTFAATIGSEMGEVVWGSEHYGVLFMLGSLLFVVSFGLNAVTELYVKHRLIKKIQGQ